MFSDDEIAESFAARVAASNTVRSAESEGLRIRWRRGRSGRPWSRTTAYQRLLQLEHKRAYMRDRQRRKKPTDPIQYSMTKWAIYLRDQRAERQRKKVDRCES